LEDKTGRCKDAAIKEWTRLLSEGVWDMKEVRNWSDLARDARVKSKTIHLGRIFGIMVEKNHELDIKDPSRKMKYRVVFQGNNVVTQNWEAALFQDLGSSPASMEAGKAVDAYGCFAGNGVEQADAEQAYVQAKLEGVETWICLPDEFINHYCPDQYRKLFFKGPDLKERKHSRPCVRLIKALGCDAATVG
jgi:hypothetical protein